MVLFVALLPSIISFVPYYYLFQREMEIIFGNKLVFSTKQTSADHRKLRARFRLIVLPIVYGIFAGTYCLNMYWAHLFQFRSLAFGLGDWVLLHSVRVGILTYRKAPPWILVAWMIQVLVVSYRGLGSEQIAIWVFPFYLSRTWLTTSMVKRFIHKNIFRVVTPKTLLRGYRFYQVCYSIGLVDVLHSILVETVNLMLWWNEIGLWLRFKYFAFRNPSIKIQTMHSSWSTDDLSNCSDSLEVHDDHVTSELVEIANLFCMPVESPLSAEYFDRVRSMACMATGPKLNSGWLAAQTLKNLGRDPEGKEVVLIFDTGASKMSTGSRDDFVEFSSQGLSPNATLDGIASGLKIEGHGTVEYVIRGKDGDNLTLQLEAMYVPDLKNTRLLSPQGLWTKEGDPGSFIAHTIDDQEDNYAELWIRKKGKGWKEKDPIQVLRVDYDKNDLLPKSLAMVPERSEFQALKGAIDMTAKQNSNISKHQKLLLQWHYKLGHIGFKHLRWLISSGVLPVRQKELVAQCDDVKCAACECGKAVKRTSKQTIQKRVPDKEMNLKKEDLFPGQRVSVDHYESPAGRLYSSRGKSQGGDMFNGGMIFVDHATGYVDCRHQVSLNAIDTIKSKISFEREAFHDGVKIQAYHSDNGIFTSKAFMEELIRTNQTIRFAGAGAGHQGGVAERGIRTIVTMARTMMLHAALRHGDAIKQELWPQAMDYAVWLYNHIPRMDTGLSPIEMWSRSRYMSASDILVNCKVWGCPVFVLEAKLRKDGVKIPKWAPRSRQGVFMGFSKYHSGLVGLILNQSTGSISAQFHCVYDDGFTTVPSPEGVIEQEAWLNIIHCPSARLQADLDEATDIPLSDEWLTANERRLRDQLRRSHAVTRSWQTDEPPSPSIQRENKPVPDPTPANDEPPETTDPLIATSPLESSHIEEQSLPVSPEDSSADSNDEDSSSSVGLVPSSSELSPSSSRYPTRASRNKPIDRLELDFGPDSKWRGKFATHYVAHLASILNKGVWTAPQWDDICEYLTDLDEEVLSIDPTYDPDEGEFFRTYKASKKRDDPDTPSYHDAMSGENSEQYLEAMTKEISDLEKRNSWVILPRSAAGDAQIVPGTWAFKAKRYPDGRFRKFKARFCVRGDVQILKDGESMDTFSPVVSWVTVRLMLILTLILGLKTKQIDFSNAFAQADLEKPVFVSLPRGFEAEGPDMVLKLNKSLYGMCDAPKIFYLKLKKGMEDRGFTCLENLDPCLFVKDDCIAFCYVDDMCFFFRDQSVFDSIIQSFKDDGDQYNWEHTIEGEVGTFLGINISRNADNESFQFLQTGLIDKILEATGMANCNAKPTPCSGDGKPLGSDRNGKPACLKWNYRSVVGMLLYLASNSRCDIAFAVHQCARFSHAPKSSHEAAVIRICRYLKGTREQGIVFKPSKDIKVDCYVDADFAGLYGTEDPHDPASVKSRTGYVILIADCPLMWQSKLQSTIALSTQHSEYAALSSACRDLLPIRSLVKRLVTDLEGLTGSISFTAKSTCFEDNAACIALAKLKKITPQNRHIGSKYHWFRSYVMGSRNKDAFLDIVKVESHEQMADIFTKNLTEEKFLAARKLLCRW